ncbi:MAG: thioredoxin family protein [Kiritimatiellae bacterium]|nr:thioredoxin family protein [Kiritimatiellia bacterium]
MKMNIAKIRALSLAVGVFAVLAASGFEYNVRQPSDYLKPTWHAADTAPGVWTLNVDDALARAKAAGKCTILMVTASWWCPYCETFEDTVLSSREWKDYVEQNGFYLAMLDFPYRNAVPADQEWKSWRPDLGKGWGFKCWLMNPAYLAEIGLTQEEGLDAIMDLYRRQGELALETADQITIKDWRQTGEFTYGKVGYLTLIVVGPDGNELGRLSFPWYKTDSVTVSEAREFVFQSIEQILAGTCEICDDSMAGVPPTDVAQEYDGWLADAAGTVAGLAKFKISRRRTSGAVRVSGKVTVDGKTTTLKPVTAFDLNTAVALETKGVVAHVAFGEIGMSGDVSVNGVRYTIGGGGRNVFKAKDAAAASRRAYFPTGIWSVVLKPSDAVAPSPYARGYGSLTVQLRNTGIGVVSGYLGDGTRVNVKMQAIVGDKGVSCLPVYASLYGKRGGFGFLLWFKNGRLLATTAVSPWRAAGRYASFVAHYTPVFTMSQGMGTPMDEMDLTIEDFDDNAIIRALPLAWSPAADIVEIKGTKWQGTQQSYFSAKCTTRTGTLKGTMKFSTLRNNGSIKKVRGTFTGVVMGGSGYGTVMVSGEGTWAVKIAVCGSCSE